MGRARSTYGGEERCIVFWWADLRQGNHLEDPGADGRIILKWILEKLDVGVDWISLSLVTDKWRAVVNSVMNIRVL